MNRQTGNTKSSSYRNHHHGNWSGGDSPARWDHDGWDEGGCQNSQMSKPPPHSMRRNSADHWGHDDRYGGGSMEQGLRRGSPGPPGSPRVGSGERLRKGRGKRPDLQVYVPRGRRMYADDEPERPVGNQQNYNQNAACPSPRSDRRRSAPHTDMQYGRGYRDRPADGGERVRKSPGPHRKAELTSPEVNRKLRVKKESANMSDFLQSRMYSDVEPRGSQEASKQSGRRPSVEESSNQPAHKNKKQRNSHDGESRRRRRSRSHDKRKSVSKERPPKVEVPAVDIVVSPGPAAVQTGGLAGMDSRLLDVDTYDQLGVDDWDGDPLQPVSPAPGALPFGPQVDLTDLIQQEPYYCPKTELPIQQPVAPVCPELSTCAHGSDGDLSQPSPPASQQSSADHMCSGGDSQQKLPLPARAAMQQTAHLASQKVEDLSGVLVSAAEASYDQGTAVPSSGGNKASDLALLGVQETYNMDPSEHQQKPESFDASHRASITETEFQFAKGSNSSALTSSGGSPAQYVTSTCIAIAPIDTVTCSSVTSVAHVTAISTAEFPMAYCQQPDTAEGNVEISNITEGQQVTGNSEETQSVVTIDSAINNVNDAPMDSCDKVTEDLETEMKDMPKDMSQPECVQSKHKQCDDAPISASDGKGMMGDEEATQDNDSSSKDGCDQWYTATETGEGNTKEGSMDCDEDSSRETVDTKCSEDTAASDTIQTAAECEDQVEDKAPSEDIVMKLEEKRTVADAGENNSNSENMESDLKEGEKSLEISCENEASNSCASGAENMAAGDDTALTVSEKAVETSTGGSGKRKAEATEEPEADSWDALFDDDGEALDPTILDEVGTARFILHIQRAQNYHMHGLV